MRLSIHGSRRLRRLRSRAADRARRRQPQRAVRRQGETADIAALVVRLDLERYKATIKGLTQFGDRLHGTDRNRAAIDWIEAELKSYGCATERFAYEYPPPEAPAPHPAINPRSQRSAARRRGRPSARRSRADDAEHRSERANRSAFARAQCTGVRAGSARARLLHQARHQQTGRDVHRERAYGRPRLWRSGE